MAQNRSCSARDSRRESDIPAQRVLSQLKALQRQVPLSAVEASLPETRRLM